ncbi:hypothetical protein AYI68_g3133 [Smittium mucronatum]|uniref:Uncharacterized protein n=1 Tax=Smittium mucronatum TaxID=133383 RepID=A0A1R0H0R3_9FUNG|nr:hypothetical protein AYI68_g3133 [Smittium mucronatum]
MNTLPNIPLIPGSMKVSRSPDMTIPFPTSLFRKVKEPPTLLKFSNENSLNTLLKMLKSPPVEAKLDALKPEM